MDGIVKRVVVAVVLLALLGVAACGGDDDASAPTPPPPWANVAPEQIAEAKKHGVPVAFENDLGMRFVLIPAGTFLMGSPGAGRRESDTPWEVTVSQPFYSQITELTNAQYRRFRPDHDSGRIEGESIEDGEEGVLSLDGDKQPVVQVSWEDAVAFSTWLSGLDVRRSYRLHTEAEWEYACRAGTATAFSFGESLSTDQANYGRDTMYLPEDGVLTTSVGTFPPNGWGLHDMHGNVCEWCLDGYDEYPEGPEVDPRGLIAEDASFILRGGSWRDGERRAASVRRLHGSRDYRTDSVGFRLISPLPEPSK